MKSLTWKLHLKSSPVRVFYFLNTDWGRQQFWAENAQQQGDQITFEFSNGQEHTAQILESKAPKIFKVEYFNSPVSFELASDGSGGTDLVLQSTDIPDADYQQTYAGWLSVLLALKAACDFRVDLRNHDPARTWDQLYVDN